MRTRIGPPYTQLIRRHPPGPSMIDTHIQCLNSAIPHYVRTHPGHSPHDTMVIDRDTPRPEPAASFRVRVRRMVLQCDASGSGKGTLRRPRSIALMPVPIGRDNARDGAGFRRRGWTGALYRRGPDRAIGVHARRGMHCGARLDVRGWGGELRLRLRPSCRTGLLNRWLHPLDVDMDFGG